MPSVPAAGTPRGTQLATVVVRLDAPAGSTASAARRPAYVSPATQSIAISFTPTGGGTTQTFNQNLTPGSPGCKASLVSPLICSVSLSIAPGSYIASFTTYDGVLNGSGVPQGNVLSQNQNFATTVVAGQTNTIDATLQGVPASVLVSPIGGTATQNSALSLTFDKCFSTQQVSVLALDADGNVIVGPGAPAITLTPQSAPFTISGPTTASPNLFTLTRSTVPAGLSVADVSAAITPGAGGPPAPAPTVFQVHFNTSNCGSDTPIGTGFSQPAGAVADTSGNVYVADTGSNEIKEVETNGTIVQFGPSISAPSAIAIDANNTIYAVGGGSPISLYRVTSTAATPLLSGFAMPDGIAVAPDGHTIYVTDQGPNNITLVSPSSGFLRVMGSGFVQLAGIAVDSQQNLYAADEQLGIVEIHSDGSQVTLASGDPHIVQTFGIAVDAAQNVYYTDLALGIVGKIPPSFPLVTVFASGLTSPQGISVAANGDIYVADAGTNIIHRYR